MADFPVELDRIAGTTPRRDVNYAASTWARLTSTTDMVYALNRKAGTTNLDLPGVLARLGGLTTVVDADTAVGRISTPTAGLLYASLPGTSGNYVSAPDSATYNLATVLRIAARVNLTNYANGAQQNIICHGNTTGNQRSLLMAVGATGLILYNASSDGVTNQITASSTAPSLTSATTFWIGVEFNCTTGACTFYKATDTGNNTPPTIFTGWTQVSTGGVTANTPFNSTSVLEIGSGNVGTANLAAGRVYKTLLYTNTSTLVSDFDPSLNGYKGTTSFISSTTSEVWTINGTASITGP